MTFEMLTNDEYFRVMKILEVVPETQQVEEMSELEIKSKIESWFE